MGVILPKDFAKLRFVLVRSRPAASQFDYGPFVSRLRLGAREPSDSGAKSHTHCISWAGSHLSPEHPQRFIAAHRREGAPLLTMPDLCGAIIVPSCHDGIGDRDILHIRTGDLIEEVSR